jgi:hypothetical protein
MDLGAKLYRVLCSFLLTIIIGLLALKKSSTPQRKYTLIVMHLSSWELKKEKKGGRIRIGS